MRKPGLKRQVISLLFAVALVHPVIVDALEEEVTLPIRLDASYLREIFASQIYTDPDTTARVWDDGVGCNFMVISEPQIVIRDGLVNLTTAGDARVGKRVGNRCVVVLDWSGYIDTSQEVELEPGGNAVRFKVVDSRIHDETVRHGVRVGTLWDWVKDYVHPRLAAVRVNLKPALDDLKGVLRLILRDEGAGSDLDSLALTSARVVGDELFVSLNMRVPASSYTSRLPAPALTPAELARFETAWQSWDSFITFIIKHFAGTSENRAVRRELLNVLLEARYDTLEILVADTQYIEPDPVRELFVKTWSRLAPVLRRLNPELPGERGLNLLSFIAAADALQTLDALGPRFDLDISLDGLRRMARIVAPELEDDPLHYDEQVDPELRRLFDFGPPPSPIIDPVISPQSRFPLVIVPEAWAAIDLNKDRVKRLNDWIPTRADLDSYLLTMHGLLTEAGEEVASASQLERDLHHLFRLLVLATAWQETCWRQYKREGGQIVPIRSPAGAVGLMQVVPTVWRGFYEPGGLTRDVGYNATAGSEILMHYLVDYAIARGEHQQEGGRDNLARATYAAYNGGPKHLQRYRNPKTGPALRRIDASFQEKYEKLSGGDELSVRSCYTD